jgi:hypothetical protein
MRWKFGRSLNSNVTANKVSAPYISRNSTIINRQLWNTKSSALRAIATIPSTLGENGIKNQVRGVFRNRSHKSFWQKMDRISFRKLLEECSSTGQVSSILRKVS